MEALVNEVESVLGHIEADNIRESIHNGYLSWNECGFYGPEYAEKIVDKVANIFIKYGYEVYDKGVGNDIMCGFDGLVGFRFTEAAA